MSLVSYWDISEIYKKQPVGEKVRIRGWLAGSRSSGGILFLTVRDGTHFIQSTLRKGVVKNTIFDEVEELPVESTLEIFGEVREDKRAPKGLELSIQQVRVLNRAEDGYPIAKKYHGPDFLLDRRHLWIRSEKMQTIFKIRSALLQAAHEWFRANGYFEVQMPTLITAACEGGSTLFEVNYFGQKAYLTQSWQLYAEAVIASLGKIYTIAPSFRAETSRTRRHLTEYWHLEVEVLWANLEDIMTVQEQLISHMCNTLAKESSEELRFVKRNPKDLLNVKPPFPRLSYDQVVKHLQDKGVQLRYGDDLGWEQEKQIASEYTTPFFVTGYPKSAKAFYHKLDPRNPDLTLSADLLAPEGYGEIIGGGQRIDDLQELMGRIRENNLNPEDYKWYVDLRRFGSAPHSGFGLGIERMLAWICKLDHIRDAIAFPRLINRVYP